MSKGSRRRKQQVSDKHMEDNWNNIFVRKGKKAKATQVHKNKKKDPLDEMIELNQQMGLYDEY